MDIQRANYVELTMVSNILKSENKMKSKYKKEEGRNIIHYITISESIVRVYEPNFEMCSIFFIIILRQNSHLVIQV